MPMNYYGFAYNFVYEKSVCKDRHECEALISEKRRKIACVVRVQTVPRIVVPARIGKRVCRISGTYGAFVNMETENVSSTGAVITG